MDWYEWGIATTFLLTVAGVLMPFFPEIISSSKSKIVAVAAIVLLGIAGGAFHILSNREAKKEREGSERRLRADLGVFENFPLYFFSEPNNRTVGAPVELCVKAEKEGATPPIYSYFSPEEAGGDPKNPLYWKGFKVAFQAVPAWAKCTGFPLPIGNWRIETDADSVSKHWIQILRVKEVNGQLSIETQVTLRDGGVIYRVPREINIKL